MAGRISNVVARVVIGGLRAHSPEVLPPDAELDALLADETGVPLDPYREVLDHANERGGGSCLLRAGRALDTLVDPFLFVLLNSDQIRVLIEKEARLSRFIHSRHIVRILDESADHIVLEHASTEEEPPRPTENLASAGQHISLLEQLGCTSLQLRLPDSDDAELAVYDAGSYRDPAGTSGFAVWHFSWQGFTPTRRPLPGLDEVLLAKDERTELAEAPESVQSVERVIRGDLGRTWTVAEVASALDTSTRSLQRALSTAGTKFSDVVDRVRLTEAKRLVETTKLTLTEIGYVTGFADTAHFSRRFKQRYGVPPSKLRLPPT